MREAKSRGAFLAKLRRSSVLLKGTAFSRAVRSSENNAALAAEGKVLNSLCNRNRPDFRNIAENLLFTT